MPSAFQNNRSNAGGGLALEIIVDDIIPDEFAGAQKRKRGGQLAARHQAALAQLALARLGVRFVDEDIQHAGLLEIEQGGQQRKRPHRVLALRA